MKTFDHGFDNEKGKGKIKRKKENSNRAKVFRYVASLNQEQISRMMENSANQFAQPHVDATGRAIMRNSMNPKNMSVQAKLEISQPGDSSEMQADKVADAVSRGDVNMSRMTMQQTGSEINAKGEGGTLTTTPEFNQQLESSKGSGSKMDEGTKSEMEHHMGTDLSGVNMHTGSTASTMSDGINAKAFTHGQDVYFKDGNYNPKSSEGKNLLAHELTHTVQQGNENVNRTIQREPNEKPPKVFRSSIFSGPGSDQLLATLNEDPVKGVVIGIGTTDPGVILIQKALNFIYQDEKNYKQLKLQKDFGPLTKKAVIKFQIDFQLKKGTNGVVGSETLEILDRETANKEEIESYKMSAELVDVFDIINKKNGGASILGNTASVIPPSDSPTEDEFSLGFEGAGFTPLNLSKSSSGGAAKFSNKNALSILDNMSKGELPFKPELGVGGASWFVVEGNPYVGNQSEAKPIRLEVELKNVKNPLIFREVDLVKIYNEQLTIVKATADIDYRIFKKIPLGQPLDKKQRGGLETHIKKTTERKMWEKVGEKIRNSPSKVGDIIYEAGGRFSKTTGKVRAVADAKLISIKGGYKEIVDSLVTQGLGKEKVLIEAGEKLAGKMKWAGRVQAAFRYGGRILIVMGIAADLYKIYRAEEKLKATLESVGGWAGASTAATAFAEMWTPMDTAGPWAWVVHGVGTLVSGAIGYWIGSSTVRVVYELVVESEKTKTSNEPSGFGGFGGGSFGGGGSGGKW